MAGGSRQNARELLAAELAAGRTVAQSAAAVGVSERTAHRWLAEDAEFRGMVESLRADMVSRALGRLSDALTEAADTLRTLLTASSESVRLGAARAVLETALKVREQTDLAERLARLEQAAEPEGGAE